MTLPATNPQPDTPEAREYNRIKRWLETLDIVVGLLFFVVLLVTGWTNKLRDLSFRVSESYALRLFIYVVLISALAKAISLGLDWYSFRLEHRFNLSNQKTGAWIGDEIKGWVLGLILGGALAELVYGLMRFSPEHWWLYAWVIFTALFVFFAQVAPVVLFPLFYKFAPLQDEELKKRLIRLGEKAGARVRGVYEWKLSEKSKKANAALIGLGNTRRIILADTLLQNYDQDEIEAVLAHELGHHVHRHIVKSIFVQSGILLAGFWAANSVLEYFVHQQKMFGGLITDFADLPLLVLVASVLSVLVLPALNAYSRFNERQADVYCWKSVPRVAPYISAMEKLNKQNLGESRPSRVVEILFHSHPAVSKRIAAAEDWARKHRPSLA